MKQLKKAISLIAVLAFLITALIPVAGLAAAAPVAVSTGAWTDWSSSSPAASATATKVVLPSGQPFTLTIPAFEVASGSTVQYAVVNAAVNSVPADSSVATAPDTTNNKVNNFTVAAASGTSNNLTVTIATTPPTATADTGANYTVVASITASDGTTKAYKVCGVVVTGTDLQAGTPAAAAVNVAATAGQQNVLLDAPYWEAQTDGIPATDSAYKLVVANADTPGTAITSSILDSTQKSALVTSLTTQLNNRQITGQANAGTLSVNIPAGIDGGDIQFTIVGDNSDTQIGGSGVTYTITVASDDYALEWDAGKSPAQLGLVVDQTITPEVAWKDGNTPNSAGASDPNVQYVWSQTPSGSGELLTIAPDSSTFGKKANITPKPGSEGKTVTITVKAVPVDSATYNPSATPDSWVAGETPAVDTVTATNVPITTYSATISPASGTIIRGQNAGQSLRLTANINGNPADNGQGTWSADGVDLTGANAEAGFISVNPTATTKYAYKIKTTGGETASDAEATVTVSQFTLNNPNTVAIVNKTAMQSITAQYGTANGTTPAQPAVAGGATPALSSSAYTWTVSKDGGAATAIEGAGTGGTLSAGVLERTIRTEPGTYTITCAIDLSDNTTASSITAQTTVRVTGENDGNIVPPAANILLGQTIELQAQVGGVDVPESTTTGAWTGGEAEGKNTSSVEVTPDETTEYTYKPAGGAAGDSTVSVYKLDLTKDNQTLPAAADAKQINVQFIDTATNQVAAQNPTFTTAEVTPAVTANQYTWVVTGPNGLVGTTTGANLPAAQLTTWLTGKDPGDYTVTCYANGPSGATTISAETKIDLGGTPAVVPTIETTGATTVVPGQAAGATVSVNWATAPAQGADLSEWTVTGGTTPQGAPDITWGPVTTGAAGEPAITGELGAIPEDAPNGTRYQYNVTVTPPDGEPQEATVTVTVSTKPQIQATVTVANQTTGQPVTITVPWTLAPTDLTGWTASSDQDTALGITAWTVNADGVSATGNIPADAQFPITVNVTATDGTDETKSVVTITASSAPQPTELKLTQAPAADGAMWYVQGAQAVDPIAVSVAGGTAPYGCVWHRGDATGPIVSSGSTYTPSAADFANTNVGGTVTYTVVATDAAGHTATAAFTYTVRAAATGDLMFIDDQETAPEVPATNLGMNQGNADAKLELGVQAVTVNGDGTTSVAPFEGTGTWTVRGPVPAQADQDVTSSFAFDPQNSAQVTVTLKNAVRNGTYWFTFTKTASGRQAATAGSSVTVAVQITGTPVTPLPVNYLAAYAVQDNPNASTPSGKLPDAPSLQDPPTSPNWTGLYAGSMQMVNVEVNKRFALYVPQNLLGGETNNYLEWQYRNVTGGNPIIIPVGQGYYGVNSNTLISTPVTAAMDGWQFRLVARPSYGSDATTNQYSEWISLGVKDASRVQEVPQVTISSSPESHAGVVTIAETGNVILTAGVQNGLADANLAYQWQSRPAATAEAPDPQWTNITDATERTYTIENAAAALNGTAYRCTVSNNSFNGIAGTSAAVSLQVNTAAGAVIIMTPTQPSLVNRFVTRTATFAVTAKTDNGDDVTYSWFRRGAAGPIETGGIIETWQDAAAYLAERPVSEVALTGATSPEYTTEPLEEGVYEYVCRVTNAKTTTLTQNSPGFYVVVTQRSRVPAITEPDPNAAFIPVGTPAGQAVTFTCKATVQSQEPMTYQWQASQSLNGPYHNLTGATSATLTIPAPTGDNDGWYYQCVVRNANQTSLVSYSTPFRLTVWNTATLPTVVGTIEPRNIINATWDNTTTLTLKSQASVPVIDPNSTTQLSARWELDGKPVLTGTVNTVKDAAASNDTRAVYTSTFSIPLSTAQAALANCGNWECVWTNQQETVVGGDLQPEVATESAL